MSETETFVHVIRDAQTGGVYLQHDSTEIPNVTRYSTEALTENHDAVNMYAHAGLYAK